MTNKFKSLMLAGLMLVTFSFAADELLGAGATFPFPLYSKMFDAYNKKTGVKVNYQAIGSGGGIKQLSAKVIDFGGTDVQMNDKEKAAAGAEVVHLPTCKGTIVLTYNLPGNPKLNISAELMSAIFSGEIKKWNDPLIVKENPGVELPATDIFVAYRSDSSGTSYLFTDYLAKVSPKSWTADKIFKTNSKTAVGGKGNAGVAGLVKVLSGSIGYVEYAYAKQNNMAVAKTPVVSGYTWIVLYKEQSYNGRSIERAKEVKTLLTWMVTDAQKLAAPLDYGELPKDMQANALTAINSLTFHGAKF